MGVQVPLRAPHICLTNKDLLPTWLSTPHFRIAIMVGSVQ